MRTAVREHLRAARARFPRRRAAQGLILLYHRIADRDVDPWGLSVTPDHFDQHLTVLRQRTQPLDLPQLVAAQHDDTLPHRAVAVTFDDGYANNLHMAKPALERHDVPATVFVVTDHCTTHEEFWWDELEQLLLQPGQLPEQLDLSVPGVDRVWSLGAAAQYGPDQRLQDVGQYSSDAPPESRLAFYHSVWRQLRPLAPPEQGEALALIRSWVGTEVVVRPTCRPMDVEELGALEDGGLVSVGAHTVHHTRLSDHSASLQYDEIRRSKLYLEDVLAHPVSSFAYPFGAYTLGTLPLVRDAGFASAFSTVEKTVDRRADRLQLPRFEVGDWNGAEFEARLLQWFGQ